MPYRPSERQYRDFAVDSFQPEVRESSDDQEQSYSVRGYFCTFREPYELFPDYYEEIDPQAFVGCDMSDVILQVNHDGFVYARNRNGSLQITTDDHGGHCVADLSGSKRGREELFEAINNGLIDRMSFGFTIADDGFEWEEDEQGVIHTRITKISKLYDVSPIAGFPANDGTEISARSLHDAVMEARSKHLEIAEEARSEETKPEEAIDPQPEETRSSQADNSIEDVTVTVDGESYEGVEDVTAKSYKGLTVEAVVEGFDIEDMATRIASILAERSAKEVSEQIGEELSEPEQEVSEPVSDSKARRMRRARALQLSHI